MKVRIEEVVRDDEVGWKTQGDEKSGSSCVK